MQAVASDWLDLGAARRRMGRAAATMDAHAVVQREVAGRMLERLDYIRLQPRVVLDLGAGTGGAGNGLASRYRKARVLALDAHPELLRQRPRFGLRRRQLPAVLADARALPLHDGCVDLVFSNLLLPLCTDPALVFAECQRVLRPGGVLLFSSLGPDTLIELRRSAEAAFRHDPVHPFIDMHDLGDAMLRARFADPVVDMERLTLTYADPDGLFADLRAMGLTNARRDRPRGLVTPGRLQALRQAYALQADGGRLPATVEVIQGHAWASADPEQQRGPEGEVRVSLSGVRRQLQGGRTRAGE